MNFDTIGFGLMVGGLLALVLFNLPLMRLFRNIEQKWMLNGIDKQLNIGPKAFRKTADELLKRSWPKFRIPFLIAVIGQGLMLLLLLFPINIMGHVEIAIGFWFIFILCYINGDIRYWPQHLEKLRLTVAKKSIRTEMLASSEAVLLRAALRTDPSVRFAVATVLKDLNSEKSLRMLAKLSQDRDEKVANAAKESRALLESELNTTSIHSVADFRKQIEHHQVLHPNAETRKFSDHADEIAAIEEGLDAFLLGQKELLNAYPNLYCTNCRCRPEKHSYLRWNWVVCPKCADNSAVVTNVESVIGQIGGKPSIEVRNNDLYLPVWDENRQASIQAEIDALEIIGGQSISYDLAISTIWDHLEASTESGKPNLPVSLIGQPPLNPSSLRLLRKLDIDLSVDLSNA